MAFSTQKDFFSIPLMDEKFEEDCKKSCVRLKSYESTADERAWARDEKVQSRYLTDLLACEASTFERRSQEIEGDLGKAGAGGSVGVGLGASPGASDSLLSHLGSMAGGDSLLEAANMRLEEYQKLLNINTKLKHDLNLSNERLKTATDQNRKIREILDSRTIMDDSTSKDFYSKVQQLTKAGKLNKNEENEMLQIHKRVDHILKAYDITRAENNHLRRIIEKMSNRYNLEKIKTEPERSTDINYLQQEVNKLRKECLMLRGMEDEYQRMRQQLQQQKASGKSRFDRDAETIKAIIRERNNLRDKLKSFNQKVGDMQKKEKSLSYDLEHQSNYCANIEAGMLKMQKYYEDQMQQAGFREQCFKQVVEELQCKEQRGAEGDVCKTDELAFLTQATLNEITKELTIKKERISQGSQASLCQVSENFQDKLDEIHERCEAELNSLKQKVRDMQVDQLKAANCERLCADAMERLEKLQDGNYQLEKELENANFRNMHMNRCLKECSAKTSNMLKKLNAMEEEMKKHAKDSDDIGEGLNNTMKLVQDISDIQMKNNQLASAVNALNTRDDQKVIDDLRKQMEDTMNRLNKCQEANQELKDNLQDRDNSLKKLKDLNNQLEAEKSEMEEVLKEAEKRLSEPPGPPRTPETGGLVAPGTETHLTGPQEGPQERGAEARVTGSPAISARGPGTGKPREELPGAGGRGHGKGGPGQGGPGARVTGSPAMREPRAEARVTGPPPISGRGMRKPDVGASRTGAPGASGATRGAPGVDVPTVGDPGTDAPGAGGPGAGGPGTGPGAGRSGVGEPKIGGPIPWSPGAGEGPGGPGAGIGEPERALGPGEGGFLAGPPASGRPETRPGAPWSAKTPVSPLALTIHDSARSGEKTGRREVAPPAIISEKKVIKPKPGDAAHLDAFVEKTVGKMRGVGSYFERDLRKILDEFIQECGFCFCRLVNPRSNLYSIAHKLYHYGIATLSFRELAYVHKKLYSRADQILPGCLLDMIVNEHTLEVKSILGCICDRLKSDHISKNRGEEQRKCCCCKSELCCNNSEDDIKEKVIKLERDIEDAKRYLEGLRAMPYKSCLARRDSVAESPNSNLRASSSHRSRAAKQFKKLKSRFVNRDDY
uniref:Uncharacterized protein n=1 Tax=Glossina austeni TaxID=7395 RepID=A0A1A9VVW9_GLOAU